MVVVDQVTDEMMQEEDDKEKVVKDGEELIENKTITDGGVAPPTLIH